MHLPILPHIQENRETLDIFLGMNHNLRLGRGEFYDMKNLTSDLFPVLSPRKLRTVVMEKSGISALADRDGLCWTAGQDLYLKGKKLPLTLLPEQEGMPRQLVSMGAYLIVLPDRKYINLTDYEDRGSIDASVTTAAPVLACQCTLDGTEIVPQYRGNSAPENPRDQSWWLNEDRGELKQYSALSGLWISVETPYVMLRCPGIGRGFSPYDGVSISGDPGLQDLSGSVILHGCSEDSLIFPGLLPEKKTLTLPITVSRKMPLMDFCIESGNRLWGCRYGLNAEGQTVNEIYCSKLGDFKNFSCFLGISTDSYAASLGSEGPFTGAVSYGGAPLFFKKDCIHKVYGTMPSTFQIQTMPCRGVAPGCSGSLAVVREVLYYKSADGICAYDGSLPQEISQALGKEQYGEAVAGGIDGKYYISMKKGNVSRLLVYDTEKGLWHKEDDLQAKLFCPCAGELFCVDGAGNLLGLTGRAEGKREAEISWMAESGIIGVSSPGNKYLSRLNIRMLLDPGSRVTVKAQYDSEGPFQILGTVQGMRLKSFVFPVLPRRCDHLRLRLEGVGMCLIFSVSRVMRDGSDVAAASPFCRG